MNFGDKLKRLRLASGLTQDELAAKLGTSKQSISRYENSEREPNIRTAKAIANALNVSLEELAQGFTQQSFVAAELSPDERQLIEDYRGLTPPGQEYIRQTMAMAKMSYSEKNDTLPGLEDAR